MNEFVKNNFKFVLIICVIVVLGLFLFSKMETSIRGFSYGGDRDGQNLIVIKADKLVQEKRFVFFSAPALRLDNGYIEFYSGDAKFKNVLSEDVFSAFPIKNVERITVTPVSVKLHRNQAVVSQLFAVSAVVNLKERQIVLKGDVRVIAGPYLLTAEELIFKPEEGVFQIDKRYVMRTAEKRTEGERVRTDVFLETLN